MKDLKNIVEQYREDLQVYTELFNKKAETDRDVVLKEAKEKYAEDPSEAQLEQVARDVFYANGFHQADIRILQNNFMTAVKLYETLRDEDTPELSDEDKQLYSYLKEALPKQVFTVEEGGFTELEEGRYQKLLDTYTEQGYFKLFEGQIKKMMNE